MWEALRKHTVAIPAPRFEGRLASFASQAMAVAAKDVRAELRTKEVASGTFIFALLVLVIWLFLLYCGPAWLGSFSRHP